MKATEWAATFTHLRPVAQADWMPAPVDYANRAVMREALALVRPGWVGLASALPDLPCGGEIPDNTVSSLLDASSWWSDSDMVRKGG